MGQSPPHPRRLQTSRAQGRRGEGRAEGCRDLEEGGGGVAEGGAPPPPVVGSRERSRTSTLLESGDDGHIEQSWGRGGVKYLLSDLTAK